jgi:hypothetical protein
MGAKVPSMQVFISSVSSPFRVQGEVLGNEKTWLVSGTVSYLLRSIISQNFLGGFFFWDSYGLPRDRNNERWAPFRWSWNPLSVQFLCSQ